MTIHLKIKKEFANSVIILLGKGSLRDFKHEIQKDSKFVYVPLSKMPEIAYENTEIVDIEPKEKRIRYYPKTSGGSFDLIGNIAILKYRESDRLKRVAREILTTNKNIKAVYSDQGVSGPYRIRDLNLIEGEQVYLTDYRENGVVMKVDLSSVYFSPRLATERLLVSQSVKKGELIVDMFSGIGTFPLNIAHKKQCEIYAIDSNPRAIDLLNENLKKNHLVGSIHPILGLAEKEIAKFRNVDRIIMNLPHDSFMYVPAAKAALKENGLINYYEIADVIALEERMEQLFKMGLNIVSKRVVHSYSKIEKMYSLTLRKENNSTGH